MSNELNPPANFDLYQARRDMNAKRNAEQDPIKRERLNLLLEQMTELDKAEPERRPGLQAKVADQLQLIQRG